MEKRTIRCPECKAWYDYEDEVILDFANTIYHKDCYESLDRRFTLEDSGTFVDVCMKHGFLEGRLFLN